MEKQGNVQKLGEHTLPILPRQAQAREFCQKQKNRDLPL